MIHTHAVGRIGQRRSRGQGVVIDQSVGIGRSGEECRDVLANGAETVRRNSISRESGAAADTVYGAGGGWVEDLPVEDGSAVARID